MKSLFFALSFSKNYNSVLLLEVEGSTIFVINLKKVRNILCQLTTNQSLLYNDKKLLTLQVRDIIIHKLWAVSRHEQSV